jgi:D-sedoheptulose 7-phosphate isomerase
MAGEFTGRFKRERAPFPAIALNSDGGLLTCIGNDYGFDDVFARQVQAHGRPGDVGFFLSTSGNSPNVTAALTAAREAGVWAVALLGKGGGAARGMADAEIVIDSQTTARIQEAHALLLHIICELTDQRLAAD